MRLFVLAALAVLVVGCKSMSTPEERYYALNWSVVQLGKVMEAYVDECLTEPASNPCRKSFPAINEATRSLKMAMQQADKVFVTGDSQYYDLSLTGLENIRNNMCILLPFEYVTRTLPPGVCPNVSAGMALAQGGAS